MRGLIPMFLMLGAAPVTAEGIDPVLFEGKGEVVSVVYDCDGDISVPTVFLNATNDESFAVAVIDGKLYGMRQVISASGARYKAPGDKPYILWTKGDTAFVMEDKDGPIIIDNCVAR